MGKLVLLSDGLNTSDGLNLISKQLKNEKLKNKKIALFYEPYYSIESKLVDACLHIGFARENVSTSMDMNFLKKIYLADYIYMTEGNTFEILKILREKGYIKPIKTAVENGAVYIGASAGALIAGKDILLAADFDRNEVGLAGKELEALGLFDGTILPHYTRRDLKAYLKKKDRSVVLGYQKIYQVANGRILTLFT